MCVASWRMCVENLLMIRIACAQQISKMVLLGSVELDVDCISSGLIAQGMNAESNERK